MVRQDIVNESTIETKTEGKNDESGKLWIKHQECLKSNRCRNSTI